MEKNWIKDGKRIRIRDKHPGSATLSGTSILKTSHYYKGDFLGGIFYLVLNVLYSTLLHLPPLRFHCADGWWDRTQDRCNWCIGSQTL